MSKQFSLIETEKLERIIAGQERLERMMQRLTSPAPKWVSIADYAKEMNVTPGTVNAWAREGKVKIVTQGKKRGVSR